MAALAAAPRYNDMCDPLIVHLKTWTDPPKSLYSSGGSAPQDPYATILEGFFFFSNPEPRGNEEVDISNWKKPTVHLEGKKGKIYVLLSFFFDYLD